MAAELPQPGVEIIQEFRTVSPTILTPTLVPCIIGVGKQIVDLMVDNGAGSSILNSEAIVELPGFFIAKAATGDPPVYGGLDGLALVVSINSGPDITVTFADTEGAGLTPASVVDQIQTAFDTAGVTAALPELIGDGTEQWQLKTVGTGIFQFIDVKSTTADAVASAFGIGKGIRYAGMSAYNQLIISIPQIAFPDPRSNLDELSIENDSIRAFLSLGNSAVQEALRDTAFLRNGVVNSQAATAEGSVDLVADFPDLSGGGSGTTMSVKLDGEDAIEIEFSAEADFADLKETIEAAVVGLTATLGDDDGLIMTSDTEGYPSEVEVVAGGTALALLGVSDQDVKGYSIETVDDGNGDALTSLYRFEGQDFTATPAATVVVGSAIYVAPAADVVFTLNDGHQSQGVTIPTGTNLASAILLINKAIGTAAGGYITAAEGTGGDAGKLKLTHSKTGTDSVINIIGSAAALSDVVKMTAGTYRPEDNASPGATSKPKAGDELWIDGTYIGLISEVAPGGEVDTLKVAVQVAISLDVGATFYIIAKNLTTEAGRPRPDLMVDLNGDVSLKQELLRDSSGDTVINTAQVYITYTAVRKDVSPAAVHPGLLRFDDTTTLEDALSPINAENPLALGLYFALLNSPGTQVTGIGVDAISADYPDGTVEAFTRAAEFLEAFEVYALAPLTHDESVHQVMSTHVTGMSAPEAKGERIAIVNPNIPTHRLDTLVASGTDGNTVGSDGLKFDTKVSSLTALVQAAGISPVGTIATSKGLFLDISSDTKKYSIKSISGTQVTIRTTFAAGENDDNYYSTDELDVPLIDEAFSVKIRGAALETAGIPDKTAIAETIAAVGRAYGNRRLWMTVPDFCAATLEGSEQIISGFYMPAAIAGMIGQNPPQQSFTNFPMSGFTRVLGSNDTFSARQMNIMAAGGAYIIVQDAQGAPLTARMALTTDMTSIETRTDSITKVVDYTAKFLRTSLRNFIGRFNITQGFLDTLGSVIQGVLGLLIETGVLIGANVNNIIQDESAPDTVLVDVTLDVPYPCNYIRLTLVI